MIKFKVAIAVVLAILIFIAGMGLKNKAAIRYANYASEITKLKNGWTETLANLVDAKQMNDVLAKRASTLDAANRKLVKDNANLKIELSEVKNKGPATTITNNKQGIPWVAHYEDQLVNLAFDMESYTFDYTLKPRAINLTLVSGTDNKWKAIAHDPALDKEVKINSMDVTTIPFKEKWYKKFNLGCGLGYLDGPIVAGLIGYNKNNLVPMAGVRDNKVIIGGMYLRKF